MGWGLSERAFSGFLAAKLLAALTSIEPTMPPAKSLELSRIKKLFVADERTVYQLNFASIDGDPHDDPAEFETMYICNSIGTKWITFVPQMGEDSPYTDKKVLFKAALDAYERVHTSSGALPPAAVSLVLVRA